MSIEIVEVMLNKTGNVNSSRAVCGRNLSVPAAVEAVKVIGTITFNFNIQEIVKLAVNSNRPDEDVL